MNQYEESAGRPLEIIVGIITLFVALISFLLLVMLVSEASIGWSLLLGSVFLSLFCYWLVQLSYRLILNKRNSGGGLLSIGGIKFWCVILGGSSCGMFLMGIYLNQLSTIVSAAGMSIACYNGWAVASKRQTSEKT